VTPPATGVDGVFDSATARDLLEWAAQDPRPIPWRGHRDGWGVLVSEVMLQQTDVGRVADRWPVFMERHPTPAAMAAAPVSAVITDWQGLGYNRRAVALHRSAVRIVERHGGEVPDTVEALEELPGVGVYTARAVAAFAFGRDVAAVDTNVGRILARRVGGPLGRVDAQTLADAAVPVGRAGEWNQAMFDLGAAICTKRSPSCGGCPVRGGCAWRGEGEDPAVGSAGVSRPQSRFVGSDRQGRARLVRVLSERGVLEETAVAVVMGWPDDATRAARVLAGLVADGLVVCDDGTVGLAL
jgi:A/G-specific adenine glycosylase